MSSILILIPLLAAAAIWWLAKYRDIEAAEEKQSMLRANKTARFSRNKTIDGAVATPKPVKRMRGFGNR